MKRIVGITGKAGSGKDTAADYLVENHNFVKVSFAAPLKEGLRAMFNWDKTLLLDRDWKERLLPDIGKSPRELMQTIGTEWGRELVHKDLWLMLAKQRIEASEKDVVISDLRFDNEADLIRSLGGSVIHLSRPQTTEVAEHISERRVTIVEGDLAVLNDGTTTDLYRSVEESLPVGVPKYHHWVAGE